MNNPQDITKYLKVLWIGPIFYAGAIGFIKLSILSLYWSAFPRKYMKICVSILSAVVIAWTIAVMLVAIFSCLPIKASWTPALRPTATCIDNVPYYYGSQIPNIITDFAILFLPLKAVYDLKMPMKQTMQLSAVLCLALVTCAFDIVRMVVLTQLPSGGNFTRKSCFPSSTRQPSANAYPRRPSRPLNLDRHRTQRRPPRRLHAHHAPPLPPCPLLEDPKSISAV